MGVKGADLVKRQWYSLEPKREEEDNNVTRSWGRGGWGWSLGTAREEAFLFHMTATSYLKTEKLPIF